MKGTSGIKWKRSTDLDDLLAQTVRVLLSRGCFAGRVYASFCQPVLGHSRSTLTRRRRGLYHLVRAATGRKRNPYPRVLTRCCLATASGRLSADLK